MCTWDQPIVQERVVVTYAKWFITDYRVLANFPMFYLRLEIKVVAQRGVNGPLLSLGLVLP